MDQRSEAIALIVGVVRREIVALGVPAPYVVKVRDGVSRVLSDFRRVVVQKPIHHCVDHPDEFLVLLAAEGHVCHILQQLQQVFDLIAGEIHAGGRNACLFRKTIF